MRFLLPALVLLAACTPLDRQRFRVRGNGFVLEVVSTADPDQVHARHFEITVDPPAQPTVRCTGRRVDDEVHEQTWDRGAETDATLYGLLGDTDYDCTISVEDGGASLSGELSFRTDPPDGLPAYTVTGDGSAWGHYTLFNTWLTGDGGTDQVLLIVDDLGRVRWSDRLPDETAVGVELSLAGPRSLWLGGGTVPPQKRTLAGAVPYSFPAYDLNKTWWHHEVAPTPHGTVLGVRGVDNTEGGDTWEGFVVEERDGTTGEKLWSWDSQSAYDAGLLPRDPTDGDPWHANALQWVDHPDGAFVSISLPQRNRILAVDPESGQLLWSLGPDEFTLTEGVWFRGQHDPEWTSDGRLLVHDNGVGLGRSRVVEYQVDVEARTAVQLWEWTEPDWYERLWGDADRLPDGSVLVTQGHCAFCQESGPEKSRIQVVDPATGEVRWRLEVGEAKRGLYRSERVARDAIFAR